jgi:rubrerythrin
MAATVRDLAMARHRSRPEATGDEAAWVCRRCSRHLGTVADGVLTEPNGDRSALPCIRHCPRCKARNIRLR